MIDVNCDMGEGVQDQEAMMAYLTSVNVACGGHAGDNDTMRLTVEEALRWSLRIGAHPGYEDRANFGRMEMHLPVDQVSSLVYRQCVRFAQIAEACGARVVHVKPHGALYNQAVKNHDLARAVAAGVGQWRRDVVLTGLAGSDMLEVFKEAGFATYAEAFADRKYEADGTLRSRKFADALLRDPQEAAAQALRISREGLAETICIHGDTPGAAQIAIAVAGALQLPIRLPA